MAPTVTAKPDFAEARGRIEAWWAGSCVGGRPAVSHARILKPDAPAAPTDGRPREARELDPAWQVKMAEWTLSVHDFPAETMPGVTPDYANLLVIPAVLAGGELEYRPDTTWIKPMDDVYERDLAADPTVHPIFRALDGMLRQLERAVGRRGLLSPPSLLDGLTTLSLFRGPQNLCLDVIERPEDVRRVSGELDRIALAAHAAWFSTLRQLDHAQTVTWAGIYAPGKCEMVQCDFAIMLSPAMFDEFALPNLRRLTEYFDYSCYHLDGTPQVRFLDALCSLPRLHAIQWNPEPPAPGPVHWVDFFRAVRRRERSLWIACSADEAVELTRQLGPDGLMLAVRGLKTMQDMEGLLNRLKT